jgi:hypothetical protein
MRTPTFLIASVAILFFFGCGESPETTEGPPDPQVVATATPEPEPTATPTPIPGFDCFGLWCGEHQYCRTYTHAGSDEPFHKECVIFSASCPAENCSCFCPLKDCRVLPEGNIRLNYQF